MKNFFPPFVKLIALAACTLALGSCSRSEYAMLPKGSSYHGVARAATPVPAAAPEMAVASTAAAPIVAIAPAAVAATTPAVVAATPVTTAASRTAAAPAPTAPAPTTVAAAPTPRLNLVQHLALSKVTRKMDKMMQQSGSVRQHDNTASTARGGISGNLRIGLILLLVGLLIGLIPGLGVVGTIVAIIGIVFIVLWLLDQV